MIDDPHIWLEDREGADALAWVEAENARTLPRLEGDSRYPTFMAEALAIAQATDRLAVPSQLYGRIYNLWRDAEHPQGLWRWTTPERFAGADPDWTIALDLDALSRLEGCQWVWHGAVRLRPEERLCLVALSQGGEDAVRYREFDLAAGAFVTGGFDLPTSKQSAAFVDADTLLVARDWGEGSLTASGYPFVLKLLRRGQALADAIEVYRGAATDQGSTSARVLSDAHGRRLVVIVRAKTFFGADTLVWTPAGTHRLDLPDRTVVVDLFDGQVILSTSEAWGRVPAGGLAAVSLAGLTQDVLDPVVLFAPGDRQALDGIGATRDRLLIVVNDNVRGRLIALSHTDGCWSEQPIALPDNQTIGIVDSGPATARAFVSTTGFLDPTTIWSLDDAETIATPVATLPQRFDPDDLVVEQHEATSSDGTRIPYFVVRRPSAPLDGTTPTIMTAYGGFEVAMMPGYAATVGKLWLERGGAYVLANIRGGGEFGPAWHDAGRKTKRQVIFDDFTSVARDLFDRGITRPARLGIVGGSNGGLLMGVAMTQHPELWRAVCIQVPLLDMQRYERIAAGASWVDEYGSMAVPEERAFLESVSPYAKLRRDVAYPEPYIWTTTKDDRVGPQHARKFAARMKELGLSYLFYEDTAGGHSGDADVAQGARLSALQMTYFAQKLMGPAAA